MRRRVAITGLGPICAIGVGVDAFWNALVEGTTGVGPIERLDASGFASKLAGEVRDFDVRQWVPKTYRKATKVMARDTELAVGAARLAADDAGLATKSSPAGAPGFPIDPARTGCQIGAGLIAAETGELSRAASTAGGPDGSWDLERWGTEDGGAGAMNNLPPLWLLKYLPNMLACHVTIVHGAEGPSNTITCAEASALLSIGEGVRVIERGDADLCFAGGAESKVNYMGLLRLTLAARAGDTGTSASGAEVSRPYAPESVGVIGEGGGIAIIEGLEHARRRGARVYAEVTGVGAAHTTGPIVPGVIDADDDAELDRGLADAITRALADAGVGADDVDAIAPSALGVPKLDRLERGALHAVFGDRLGSVPTVTVTPNVGNCSAGHGGVALAAAAIAVERQALPARINAGRPVGMDAGQVGPREARLDHVLVCTPALGGQNAAIVLSRVEREE